MTRFRIAPSFSPIPAVRQSHLNRPFQHSIGRYSGQYFLQKAELQGTHVGRHPFRQPVSHAYQVTALIRQATLTSYQCV